MTATEPHDPTASATIYPDHPAAPPRLSRNEIETLCLKAARGAGLAWGLAEEAGFAAGWLAAHGIDGATTALHHLNTLAPAGTTPIGVANRHWQDASGTALCPIALGAALDDHASLAESPHTAPITTGSVSQPVLLVPFLARMAQANGAALSLTWHGGTICVGPDGVDGPALIALSQVAQAALTLAPCAAAAHMGGVATPLAPIPAATLGGLNRLSMRTTVPASVVSRLGAGAAQSDND